MPCWPRGRQRLKFTLCETMGMGLSERGGLFVEAWSLRITCQRLGRQCPELLVRESIGIGLAPRRRCCDEAGRPADLSQVASIEVGIRTSGERIVAAVVGAGNTAKIDQKCDSRYDPVQHQRIHVHDCPVSEG